MTTQLRRGIGLRTVVSTSTGLSMAAINYLAVAGLVVFVAGDQAWIAIAVAGLLALIAWAFYGELNGLFPTAAAIRLFMARSMDDRVALSVTFTYMATLILVIAADAFIIGSAVAHVLGQPAWAAAIYIAALLGLATWSNLRGIRVAGGLQDVATFTVLSVTTLIAVLGIVRSASGTHHIASQLNSNHSMITAIALGVFLYSAFEWVTANAEEVRRPGDIPRGMLISLGILCAVCAVLSVAMSRLLSGAELRSAYPQVYLGSAVLGRAGIGIMLGVTVLTAINTFNGGFLTASRFMYAAAREGNLPRAFSRLNDNAVPWVPVVCLAVGSTVVALMVAATSSWEVLVATGAALEAGIYTVAGYCVLTLRKRQPDADRPFRIRGGRTLAVVGMAIFGTLALAASVTVGNSTNPTPLAIIAVTGAFSTAYVLRVIPRLRAAEAERLAAAGGRQRRRPVRAESAVAAALPEESA
ncbi:MAG: APC family permease [Actinomycetota bacterium]